ncbi:MAG: hypothetical protein ACYC4Q_05850 [Victivallaceae bacterium]
MKKRINITVFILIIVALFIMAGALPLGAGGTDPAVIFNSPVFIMLNAVLASLLIFCALASFKKSLRYVSFLLVHIAAAIIIIGAFICFLHEEKLTLLAPTDGKNPAQSEQQLFSAQDGSRETLLKKMGFKVFCMKFHIDYFPVDTYQLYQKSGHAEDASPRLLLTAKIQNEYLDLGKYGRVKVSELKSPDGFMGWKLYYQINDTLFLLIAKPSDKHYFCTLKFVDSGNRETSIETRVNHPAVYKGWRFYLMDYDHKRHSYAVLIARSDPGRYLVITGVWLLMAATAVLCYILPRRGKKDDQDASSRESAKEEGDMPDGS